MTAKTFDANAFDRLYSRFDGVTWYLQAVLNRVWERPDGFNSDTASQEAIDMLIAEGEMTFHDLLNSQTDAARRVLKAVAREGLMRGVSSKAMIDKYDLPTGSTVRSVVADLTRRDILFRSEDGYRVYDRLFGFWLSGKGA